MLKNVRVSQSETSYEEYTNIKMVRSSKGKYTNNPKEVISGGKSFTKCRPANPHKHDCVMKYRTTDAFVVFLFIVFMT